jgi:hypothetical protein
MYKRLADLYCKCFDAKPTSFLLGLKKLHDEGLIVGDIITNNYDGLAARVGLKEKYVRRFDDNHIFPRINFHPKARSLLVVGCHADRRHIQAAARTKGLKVIYIDPEGFYEDDGFTEYPIEGPQSCDMLYRRTAAEAMSDIISQLSASVSIKLKGRYHNAAGSNHTQD